MRLADGTPVSRMVGYEHADVFPVASADGRQMMLIEQKTDESQFSVWPLAGVAPAFSRVRLPPGHVARHADPETLISLTSDEVGQHFIVM